MHAMTDGPGVNKKDDYLYGRGTAWFAFAMTVALMLFDYICLQRQAPSP